MIITPKALHNDLARIVDEWIQQTQAPHERESISGCAVLVSDLLAQRSALIEARRKGNAEIGVKRRSGSDVGVLIDHIKKLSTEIKTLDRLIGNATADLLQWQPLPKSQVKTKSPEMPGQFLPHQFSAQPTFLSVVVSEENEADSWDDYVSSHPKATHYHQYAWRALIDRNFGHASLYLVARNADGEVSGVLPIVHMKSVLFGSFLLSMPWLIYGGTLSSDEATHVGLSNHVRELMSSRDCTHADLREIHPRDGWTDIPGKVSMIFTLPENHEQFNRELGSKLRAQVKRAARESPEVEFGGRALVSEFYRVFSEKMRDLGTPVYHEGFFHDIATTFPDSVIFVVVRIGGKPAAAACLLGFRNTLEVPWAASRKCHNKAGINMFMYHAVLEEAIHRGYRFFDFGRSTEGESTYRFKAQWGAQPYSLAWQRYSRVSDAGDDVGRPGIVMRTASHVWKRMPVALANRLGPYIARNLPW